MRWTLLSLAACHLTCLVLTCLGPSAFVQAAGSPPESGKHSSADTALAARSKSAAKSQVAWHTRESANFRVFCPTNAAEADRLVARCEQLRDHLTAVWLAKRPYPKWDARCDIVLHAFSASYLQAVGRGAEQTVGSALIEAEGDKIVVRRIDLRPDRGNEIQTALAHELTHIVVADRIDRSQLPPWADEGMAVLADNPQKQKAHFDDFRLGVRQQNTFRAARLLSLTSYPAPQQQGVFYGQSASLVSFLVARGTPEQFVQFLEHALKSGYDRALRDVYGIAGVDQLERLWMAGLQRREINFASYIPGKIWERSAADEG